MKLGTAEVDAVRALNGYTVAGEYDGWRWHGNPNRRDFDDHIRNPSILQSGEKVRLVIVRGGHSLPSPEQLSEALRIVCTPDYADKPYVIELPEWGEGTPVATTKPPISRHQRSWPRTPLARAVLQTGVYLTGDLHATALRLLHATATALEESLLDILATMSARSEKPSVLLEAVAEVTETPLSDLVRHHQEAHARTLPHGYSPEGKALSHLRVICGYHTQRELLDQMNSIYRDRDLMDSLGIARIRAWEQGLCRVPARDQHRLYILAEALGVEPEIVHQLYGDPLELPSNADFRAIFEYFRVRVSIAEMRGILQTEICSRLERVMPNAPGTSSLSNALTGNSPSAQLLFGLSAVFSASLSEDVSPLDLAPHPPNTPGETFGFWRGIAGAREGKKSLGAREVMKRAGLPVSLGDAISSGAQVPTNREARKLAPVLGCPQRQLTEWYGNVSTRVRQGNADAR